VFVILDVSGSMVKDSKFANVQGYLDRDVIDGLLKPGDRFTLIAFGDRAAERISRAVSTDADKAALKAEIAKIQADNDYTDIGMAMERLSETLDKREEAGTRKVILFITDGLNAPPPGSPYAGKNLSLDERFKSIGEKISKGGWFLYVVGIGGQTDAAAIADAVPGSQLLTTDAGLSGVDVAAYADEVEKAATEREAAAAAEEAARLEAEKANSGLSGFLNRLSAALGFPAGILLGGILLITILIILAIIILAKIFKTVEVAITDEKETLTKTLAPFAGILLNSPAGFLPALGVESSQVLRISRSAFGLKVQVNDEAAIADSSPYKKRGTYPLTGVINLANGKIVRATIR
jgi:hypothetical protein